MLSNDYQFNLYMLNMLFSIFTVNFLLHANSYMSKYKCNNIQNLEVKDAANARDIESFFNNL